MNNKYINFLKYTLILCLGNYFISCDSSTETKIEKAEAVAPNAEKIPFEIISHGQKRTDNYFWMRLSDEQKNSVEKDEQTQKVINYLNAENDYRKQVLKHTEVLQKKLYIEMKGRILEKDESVPYSQNGYWYYTRYEEGQEYPVYCRKKGDMKAKEEIMLNVNEMVKGHSYYQVSGLNISEDNNLLAFGVDTLSRRKYTIYVKDLATGKITDTPVPETTGSSTWANDNKTLFYTKKDPSTLRSHRIYKHKLGTDPKNDPIVYEENDETFSVYVYKTKSKKYLVIGSSSTLTNHYQILDSSTPDGEFKEFSPREKGLEYNISHYQDKFYMVTNWDAVNFRLMETNENNTSKNNWKEKIAHRENVLLSDIEVFENHLVLIERSNALLQMKIISQKDNKSHYVNFGEPAYTASPTVNIDFNTNILRYNYTSLTTPNSTYDYNMNTGDTTLLKRQTVVGGHDPNNYVTERFFATAKDGTIIPMSILYKKGIKRDGNNPTLIYAYGSYGNSTDPYFNSNMLSLVNRGFVYAIAHIRGGQEMGRQWYEDGKMFKKINTFTDFIDCSEYLIEQKYTNSDKLFAYGGSAGGLLMGAIINMKPEIYKGVIAAVPFVDVVSTMEDESIPLTTGEFDEWGNPKNKASFDYMLSYSPYDQVKAQNYPSMLVTTGLHDSQVQYWEPAKWVAKLREMKTDDNLLLLRTNMETGHGGASGRFKYLEEQAENYAFLLELAGIKE
ncbi:MAG: S9 family peptidase [Bacteroidota bacterium]|nr:S9 family peptidase [Bacteroidota bacterium]